MNLKILNLHYNKKIYSYNLINFGLKDGIKKSIDSVIETGKEAVGIVTGNFENVTQIQKVVKNGGIIDFYDGMNYGFNFNITDEEVILYRNRNEHIEIMLRNTFQRR